MYQHAISMLLVLLLALSFQAKTASANTGKQQAFDRIEQIRRQAGMPVFRPSPQLDQAAQGHANYLLNNNLTGHIQSINHNGFTGATPEERAIAAGYSNRAVTENVSSGNRTAKNSIDGLMTAIYHRFGFLNFQSSEIGIAAAGLDTKSSRFVYNMGTALFGTACQAEEPASGTYYNGICPGDKKLAADLFDKVNNKSHARSPAIVVWPAIDAHNASPVFFDESPDPLPDYSVSGNPISIQFNDFYFKHVEVTEFRLFDADGNEISDTRLIDKSSDINQRFSDHEFALFPLERLDWDSQYHVVLSYSADGENYHMEWDFSTHKPLNLPLKILRNNGQQFLVGSGSEFALYIPPDKGNDIIGGINYSFSANANVNIDYIDKNTLRIMFSGNTGNQLNVQTGNGKKFSVRLENSPVLSKLEPTLPSENSCILAGLDNEFSPADKTMYIPHVLVDGSNAYSLELKLISTQPEITFLLTSSAAAVGDDSCRTASYSERTGELYTPLLKAPGLGNFSVEFSVDKSHGDFRFVADKITSLN